MKITVLVENTTKDKNLKTQHGLSLYIETENHNILFDLGEDNVFLDNAKSLGKDIEKVDVVIISHGHYDHGGGIEYFLKNNKKAKIYISSQGFKAFYSKKKDGKYEYIGLDPALKKNKRIVFINENHKIDDDLSIHGMITGNEFKSVLNNSLFLEEEGLYFQDDFKHEQSLLIRENGKYTLLAGCAHAGIVNIINEITKRTGTEFDNIVGGFHLCVSGSIYKVSDEFVDDLGRRLLDFKANFYTCHCTGTKEFEKLKTIMDDKIKYISTGERILI